MILPAGGFGVGQHETNLTSQANLRDPRKLGLSLKLDQPDPEEGRRLVQAYFKIKDAKVRLALIEYTEALAMEKNVNS